MSLFTIIRSMVLLPCVYVTIVSSTWTSRNKDRSLKTYYDIRFLHKLYLYERRKSRQLSLDIVNMEQRLSELESKYSQFQEDKIQTDRCKDHVDKRSHKSDNGKDVSPIQLISSSGIFNKKTIFTTNDQPFIGKTNKHDLNSDYVIFHSMDNSSKVSSSPDNYDKVKISKSSSSTANYVSVTAIGTNVSFITPNSILRFTNVKSAFGIHDLQFFIQTGTFVCEHIGLYLIAVSVRICTTDITDIGSVALFKNKDSIVSYHVEYSSDPTVKCLTVGGVAVVELNPNDTINVRTNSVQMEFYGSYSSISISQIK